MIKYGSGGIVALCLMASGSYAAPPFHPVINVVRDASTEAKQHYEYRRGLFDLLTNAANNVMSDTSLPDFLRERRREIFEEAATSASNGAKRAKARAAALERIERELQAVLR